MNKPRSGQLASRCLLRYMLYMAHIFLFALFVILVDNGFLAVLILVVIEGAMLMSKLLKCIDG